MIDRNSPVPIYYQLKLYFKRQIENGELKPGDRLPTEMELCEQFDISRAPVRQAMTELAREGVIYRRPGQGTFVSPAMAAAEAERTKIRVLAHHDVRWMASLESAVLRWNQAHPTRQAELEIQMSTRQEFHQVLRRAAIQGEAPDIASMDFAWLAHYAADGYLASLNAADAEWAETLIQDLETPVLHNNIVNDQLYGVPVQADISGIWYRKDWFELEGLELPKTWEAWLSVIDHFAEPETIQKYGHRYPIVLPVTATTGEATVNLLIPFIWMTGGRVMEGRGELALEQHMAEITRALSFLQEITVKRRAYLPQDVYRSRWWHLARFFARGDVPMALGGSYEWPRIREESEWENEEDAAEHLGFTLLPRPSTEVPPVGSLGGTSWAIFEQSEIKELCAGILRTMAVSDVSAEFCEENLQISPYRSVNQRLTTEEHPWLSQVVPLLAYARNRPLVSSYVHVSNFLAEMFERALWEGENPEVAIKETAQALTVVLSTNALT